MHEKVPAIGICMSRLGNSWDTQSLITLCDTISDRGYCTMIFATFYEGNNVEDATAGAAKSIYSLVQYDMLEGMVIFSESIQNDDIVRNIIAECKKAGVPVVSYNKVIEGCHSVQYDYKKTFKELVSHLIEEHGCKTINMVAGIKGNDFSEDRLNAFRGVMQEHGLPVEEERIGYGEFWEGPTVKVMEDFFATGLPMPDAIVCANDSMAMAVCDFLLEHDYLVPDDVLVTGFDGFEMEQLHTPRLTTAEEDRKAAFEAAMDIIEGLKKGETVPEATWVPFHVRTSESCGCKPLNTRRNNKKVFEVYNSFEYCKEFQKFINGMSMQLTNCNSLDAAIDILKDYIFEGSWLCINSSFFEKQFTDEAYYQKIGYDEYMQVVLHRINGVCDTEVIRYPSKNILPDFYETLSASWLLVFLPVYFQSEVIGFYAAPPFGDVYNYINMQYFVTVLGQSLMMVRNAERMTYMYTRDQLTGIYNRRGFYQRIKQMLSEHQHSRRQLTIHSVDLDGLKYINDTFGHKEGDNAIRVAADTLRAASISGEIFSRFGGDEYVVAAIVSEGAEEKAGEYVKKFYEKLAEYNRSSGKPYEVQASLGTCIMDVTPDLSIDQIINSADKLMYSEKARHKRDGRR